MYAQLQPADAVVERMLTHMTSQEPGYRYFNIDPGRPHIVTVLVSTCLITSSPPENTCDEEQLPFSQPPA